MSDALRLAVVGVGRMGAFHAETLAAMDTIDVVAVSDTRPEVAREVGEKAVQFSFWHNASGRPRVIRGD